MQTMNRLNLMYTVWEDSQSKHASMIITSITSLPT